MDTRQPDQTQPDQPEGAADGAQVRALARKKLRAKHPNLSEKAADDALEAVLMRFIDRDNEQMPIHYRAGTWARIAENTLNRHEKGAGSAPDGSDGKSTARTVKRQKRPSRADSAPKRRERPPKPDKDRPQEAQLPLSA